MKIQSLIVLVLGSLLSSLAFAQSVQTYVGTSPLSASGSRTCEVKLHLDNQKQIISIDTQGPSRHWDILTDNPSGFGPAGNILFESGDPLLTDPQSFAGLQFVRSGHPRSESYSLKSSKTAEGVFKTKIQLDFEIKQSKLVVFKKTVKFRAAVVVPLASSTFECNDLSKN